MHFTLLQRREGTCYHSLRLMANGEQRVTKNTSVLIYTTLHLAKEMMLYIIPKNLNCLISTVISADSKRKFDVFLNSWIKNGCPCNIHTFQRSSQNIWKHNICGKIPNHLDNYRCLDTSLNYWEDYRSSSDSIELLKYSFLHLMKYLELTQGLLCWKD